jgi:hypothetical protein
VHRVSGKKELHKVTHSEDEFHSRPAFQYVTPAIEKRLPKVGNVSHADWGGKPEKVPIIVKYFIANWTWYVLEGNREPDTGDFIFFGWVEGNEKEFGYFRLSDVAEARLGAVRPERDLYFFGYLDYCPKPFRVTIVESPMSEVLKVCGNPEW